MSEGGDSNLSTNFGNKKYVKKKMKSYLNHIKVDQKVKDLLKEIKQRQRKGSMINKYFYYHKFSLAFKYDK